MLVPLFPPPPPLSDFSPTINLTFWVSMGMNSQPPIPPCPAYPRLLISPWILQLAYSLYPLVTRGHQRPPPHTAGKFNPPILDIRLVHRLNLLNILNSSSPEIMGRILTIDQHINSLKYFESDLSCVCDCVNVFFFLFLLGSLTRTGYTTLRGITFGGYPGLYTVKL